MQVTIIILKAVRTLCDIALDVLEGREKEPAKRVEAIWTTVESEIARAERRDRKAGK